MRDRSCAGRQSARARVAHLGIVRPLTSFATISTPVRPVTVASTLLWSPRSMPSTIGHRALDAAAPRINSQLSQMSDDMARADRTAILVEQTYNKTNLR